jgi:chromosomal replication initiator protein
LELPAQLEPEAAWREIRAEARRMVGESTYEIWLAPLEVQAWEGAVLFLQAPPATHARVAKRFGRVLESCARAVTGEAIQVTFSGPHDEPHRRPVGTGLEPPAGNTFNPRYTFEQFIIGDGNRLAHAASLAVSELPGQAYNPLFVYAPPGLGKTHLLHAIGNYVYAFGAGATVRYSTVEAFTNHFITALGTRSIDHFKHAYRDADVLLIDDVQFLASKVKTEEEFFHTFNALYEDGRQLVLTCDRLPRQLINVEERLRERFESGLVAEIQPPDFATRVAILRKRAVLDRVALNDTSVLELIAERITENVRALEGALIRIVAYHSLARKPIDVELAETVLNGIQPGRGARVLTIQTIQATVAAHYKLTVEELLSSSRAVRVAWPRQVAIYLARDLTDASLHTIGDAFAGRNHATVLHACKRVAELTKTDSDKASDLNSLAREVSRLGDRND